MKKYSELGNLIKGGKTSPEIRLEIKGFPFNPSLEYFMRLGYTEKTARKYMRMLRKNDENLEKEEFEFIFSENADPKKIILDTCALGFMKTMDLLERAEEVTVLLATLREMDTQKNKKQVEEEQRAYFVENIRFYSKKFLLEEKYKLVPFDGIKKDNYHDNIIIQYLWTMHAKDRPTILTVDAILADKAKCYGLEYILYNPEPFVLTRQNNTAQKKQENVQETSKIEPEQKLPNKNMEKMEVSKQLEKKREQNYDKISVSGVVLQLKEEKVNVKRYNDTTIVMQLMENGKYQEVFSGMVMTKEIVVISPTKKVRSIYISRVQIKDGYMSEETKQYFYLNEIYIEEWIPEEIEKVVKDLF